MKRTPTITDPAVAAVFENIPSKTREKLLSIRTLIFDTAAHTEGVGELDECLKWGEPSYLTNKTKSGSTIRIAAGKSQNGGFGIYFNCNTSLVEDFRNYYSDILKFSNNRAILFDADDDIPIQQVSHCISMALTYHSNKKRSRLD